MKKIGIIIAAGGAGTRMGGGTGDKTGDKTGTRTSDEETPKQFMLLCGRPVLARTIDVFRSVAREGDIVVSLPAGRLDEWAKLCSEHDVPAHKVCEGGATRFASVRNALRRLDPECEYIAVHDAARPLVSPELILRTFEVAGKHGSAIPVVPLIDSVRRITENGSYPDNRTTLRAVQTPQVFRADILHTGYERAAGENFGDDAAVVESVGYTVMLCEGERRNLKLTEPEDMTLAGAIIKTEE